MIEFNKPLIIKEDDITKIFGKPAYTMYDRFSDLEYLGYFKGSRKIVFAISDIKVSYLKHWNRTIENFVNTEDGIISNTKDIKEVKIWLDD